MPVSGRAQMTSAPESPGMIKIGRPVVRALPLLIAVCVPACPLLAVPTAEAFGDAAWRYPLALVCWLALLPGAIILCLVLWYRPVAFDPGTRMARLGWREVPLSTVTTARREVSTGTSATYLSYRFASTDGAWGRVLVAGRPMRGLSPEGLRRLERFVEAAGIHDPADEDALTPTQRYLADQLSVSRMLSTKSTVGKAALLAELRGEPLPEPFHPPGQGPPPAPGQAQPPTLERWQPPTPEQWQRDDRDAEAYLLDQPVVGRNAR